MKRKIMPVIIAVCILFAILAVYYGIQIIEKYTPTKEFADKKELFHTEGVSLIFNEELQDTYGIFIEGETYIPVNWVNEHINERFYWNQKEKLLIYTLPEEILYADHDTLGSDGKPVLWVTDDNAYLSLGLILNYTDIRIEAFDSGDIKRVFINNSFSPEQKAMVRKNARVRVQGGIKSPIITTALKESKVTVLSKMDKWSYVRTEDGYLGYVQSRFLNESVSETPESKFEAPVYTSISLPEKVVLVWHQVTVADANNNLEKLLAETEGINVISPTWFALSDNNGNYTSLANREYVDKAHSQGIQVWALLDNFSKNVQSEVLLSSTENRKKLVDSLINETKTYDLDGLNLDFEGIKQEAGVHYIQFIRELSIACRREGIVLSIDNYVPQQSNEFYNRKEQGIVADYVIIMGYDEHYAGSEEAGSVASIFYVENGIIDTLKVVPKEKVINAVPLYTRVWTENDSGVSSSALGISSAVRWVEENDVELYWQDALGQYYGECDSDEGRKRLWMEEERSLGLKMDLIKENDLAGVACWKLGLEIPEIWDVIGW